jgi:type II secretory pathway pseudopilin PulG
MRDAQSIGGRDGERGASLVSVIAGLTIMAILMSAAVPFWSYVMKDAREEELLFRGEQIARAIEKYQAKNGGTMPPNLEILVQQRFLRKACVKEPFAKDGKWRLVRPGEPILPPGLPGVPPTRQRTPPSTMVGQAPTSIGGTITVGGTGIMGVASFSKDKSLRIFNGRTRYDEWLFVAGQLRMVGRQGPRMPGTGPLPSPSPSLGPGIRRPGEGPGMRRPGT